MSAAIKARIRYIASTHDLWQIAETGDVGQLRQLLARGADVNASNGAGATALMLAAYHGRLEMVRALTDHGADVNLTDGDGVTAAMLADRSGHDEIVKILVARGAKHIPKRSVQIASLDPFSQGETFETFSDAKVTSTGGNPAVKALHAPPNIWDVVHETRKEFNPRLALFGHLTKINPLVVVLMAIIAGELAVIGFMNRKTRSESAPETSSVQTSKTSTVPATMPSSTSVSNQQPSSPATETGQTQSLQPPTNTSTENRLAASIVKPKIAVPAPKKPEKAVVTKPPGEEGQTNPILSGTQTLAGTDKTNKDESKESTTRPPKMDLALPQTDNEKSSTPIAGKKEEAKKEPDRPSSPPVMVPPKANPTPKLR